MRSAFERKAHFLLKLTRPTALTLGRPKFGTAFEILVPILFILVMFGVKQVYLVGAPRACARQFASVSFSSVASSSDTELFLSRRIRP